MKRYCIYFFQLFLSVEYLSGCPTCVGRITHDAPPFFSQEFYDIHLKNQSLERDEAHVYKTASSSNKEELSS